MAEVVFSGRLARARRQALGLSQRALAARSRISQSAVKLYERGATQPRRVSLSALAVALECPVADLCEPVKDAEDAKDDEDAA